jgi:hypothetical protein
LSKYIYAISDGQHIKVGISKHPEKRLGELNVGNANKLYLLGYYAGDLIEEAYIHDNFSKIRIDGEWMNATDDLLDYLNSKMSSRYLIIMDGKIRSLAKMSK